MPSQISLQNDVAHFISKQHFSLQANNALTEGSFNIFLLTKRTLKQNCYLQLILWNAQECYKSAAVSPIQADIIQTNEGTRGGGREGINS